MSEERSKTKEQNSNGSGRVEQNVMQIAKCVAWDGREFFTDKTDAKSLRNFWSKLKKQYTQEQLKQFDVNRMYASVTVIEMTPKEYYAIPATNESADLFS
jgi:hypothetical protein